MRDWFAAIAIWLSAIALAACSTINVTITGDGNRVAVEQPKTVTTAPAIQGNVPIQGGEVSAPTLQQAAQR